MSSSVAHHAGASTGRRTTALIGIVGLLGALLSVLAARPADAIVPETFVKKVWGTDGPVRAVVETPDAIFIGGDFANLVGPRGELVPRGNLAALDPATGAPLDWTADARGIVWALALSSDSSTLYVGGQFTDVSNVVRNRVAAVDTTSGAVTDFNPDAGGRVRSIAVAGDRVYLGGDFTALGGASRARLAAVDATTGTLIPSWTATANGRVHSVVASKDGSRIFVGGAFSSIGGSSQSYLAWLSATTGVPQTYSSRPSDEVIDITVTGTSLFAAVGGSSNAATAWNLSTGARQWSVGGDGDPQAVAVQNGVLYVGGHFTSYDDRTATGHLVAVNPATGALLPWAVSPNSNLGVFDLYSFQGNLSVVGQFTKINSLKALRYARFSEFVDVLPPSVPAKPVATAASARSATVTWPASTDNVAASITYTVHRDGGATPVGTVTSSATGTISFTDTGLAPVSTHTWQVRASDGDNASALSEASDPVTTPVAVGVAMTGLEMLDNDVDGKVDRVLVGFEAPITCTSPCRTPWTLSGVPGAGSLSSVTVSGSTATLLLTEGSTTTAVGSFTVSLAESATGVKDADGNLASFAATAPADKAGPVPTGYATVSGSTRGVPAPGDSITVTFSEPLAPSSLLGSGGTARDPLGSGDDTIEVPGLLQGLLDTGSGSVISLDGGVATWAGSTLSLMTNDTQVRSTVTGSCSGNGCNQTSSPSSHSFVVTPAATLTDLAGNPARGSYSTSGYVY